jgi:hypothetical protein
MKNKCLLTLYTTIFLLFIAGKTSALNIDSLKHHFHLELSFGSSKLFIPNADESNLQNRTLSVIPTGAMLFYAEFFSANKIRVPLFYNLPTETKKFLVNGQLINEDASQSIGTGLEFRIFNFKLDNRTHIELEAGPLIS